MSKYFFFFMLATAVLIVGCKERMEKRSAATYDTKKTRVLVQTAGLNIYTSAQGMIDLDSAMKLACNAQKVSTSLWYDEGYHKESNLKGQALLDKDDTLGAIMLCNSLTGKEKVLMLLQLGGYFLFKPGKDSSDLKNSINFLQLAKKESDLGTDKHLHLEVTSMMGKYYAQLGDLNQSNILLSGAVTEAQHTGNPSLVAAALTDKGSWLPYSDASKLSVLRAAFSIYQQQGDKVKEIELMNKILDIHFRAGKMDSTTSELLETLKWQQEIGFRHTHYTHSVLSFLYSIKSDYANQFVHALDAVNIMKGTGDTTFAASFYLRLGSAFSVTNRIDDAVSQFKLAINSVNANPIFFYKNCSSAAYTLAATGRDKEALALLNTLVAKYPPNNLLDKMILANTYGNVYQFSHQDSTAEKYFFEAASIGESINNPQTEGNLAACYSYLAVLYAHKKDIAKAAHYLALSQRVPVEVLDGLTGAHNMETRYLIDSLSGNFPLALKRFQEFTAFVNHNAAVDVEIKYQTSKKEQDIQFLNKQASFQQIQLAQAKTIRNVTFGAIALLIIVAGLIYNQYRMNRKNSLLVSKKNLSLQQLLTEKEWLLREIHHRVKNNLQIVISLLNSQSSYLDNEDALLAIKNSQHRMHSMSLIHQKLYQSHNLASIEMNWYIRELVSYMKDSFATGKRIEFTLDLLALELDVVQAVPLGLIINEAISNTIKYAFPNGANGKVLISLQRNDDGWFELRIADNGIGFSQDYDPAKSDSLGMELMKGLTEQLEGVFEVENINGLSVSVTFKKHTVLVNHEMVTAAAVAKN